MELQTFFYLFRLVQMEGVALKKIPFMADTKTELSHLLQHTEAGES